MQSSSQIVATSIPTFYTPDALPVAQLNAPKHWALFDTNAAVMKKLSERRKHCALAEVRRAKKIAPPQTPFLGAAKI